MSVQRDSATKQTQGEFEWTLATDTGAIGSARLAFETWLREACPDDELLEDMSVVISELASNAIEGADPLAPEAHVHALLEDDVLELTVSNRPPAEVTDIRRWDLDDTLRGGGRGLMIVRAYTDSLAIESSGDLVSVRCTRQLPDPS